MLRYKIRFIDDQDNEWTEYWKIKDYILAFDDYLWSLQEGWGVSVEEIKLVEIHFHKHSGWPYKEKEIIPNERN